MLQLGPECLHIEEMNVSLGKGPYFSDKIYENLPYHNNMQTEGHCTDRRVSGNHKVM